MNEEALIDAHGLFVKNGYEGKLSDFKNLISTNKEALIDAHKLFVKEGYNGNVNDFSLLIGVKKKRQLSIVWSKNSRGIKYSNFKENFFIGYRKAKSGSAIGVFKWR